MLWCQLSGFYAEGNPFQVPLGQLAVQLPLKAFGTLDALWAMIVWSWISCQMKLPSFLQQTCIHWSQNNSWNSFHTLAVNTFSCCHFYISECICSVKTTVYDKMAAITCHRVGRPKLPGSLISIWLRESVFSLWSNRKEAMGFSECTDSEFVV